MDKYFFMLLLIVVGCQKNIKTKVDNQKQLKEYDISFNDSTVSKSNYFSEIFEFNKIIDLETTTNSLISSIEKIFYDAKNNLIVIHDKDNSNILLFDTNGKFLRVIGKKGSGPGEYFQPDPIAYDNEKIAVHSKDGRLLYFNIEGNLIGEVNYRSKGWKILPNKMIFYGKDLYIYTTSKYYNLGADNLKHSVFKIVDSDRYYIGYGNYEDNYGLTAGDIVVYQSNIIFTGVFSGKVFRIFPEDNTTELFASFGPLYDVNKIIESEDPFRYIVKHLNELNTVSRIGVVKDYLCITRVGGILSIINHKGNIVARNLIPDIRFPDGYEGNSQRLLYDFYIEGIIFASTKISQGPNFIVDNPSLILYKLKS